MTVPPQSEMRDAMGRVPKGTTCGKFNRKGIGMRYIQLIDRDSERKHKYSTIRGGNGDSGYGA